MRKSNRYLVVKSKKKFFLLSNTSTKIILALCKGSTYTYQELSDETGAPTNSLYVFCQRLENAGLIKREKRFCGDIDRVRTFIKLSKKIKLIDLSIVK